MFVGAGFSARGSRATSYYDPHRLSPINSVAGKVHAGLCVEVFGLKDFFP